MAFLTNLWRRVSSSRRLPEGYADIEGSHPSVPVNEISSLPNSHTLGEVIEYDKDDNPIEPITPVTAIPDTNAILEVMSHMQLSRTFPLPEIPQTTSIVQGPVAVSGFAGAYQTLMNRTKLSQYLELADQNHNLKEELAIYRSMEI